MRKRTPLLNTRADSRFLLSLRKYLHSGIDSMRRRRPVTPAPASVLHEPSFRIRVLRRIKFDWPSCL
jgi:hypothetical protein